MRGILADSSSINEMVELTRLNNMKITINAIYIERVEATPDTVVTLTTGKKVHVLESVEEVTKKVTSYYEQLQLFPILKETMRKK